MKIEIVRSHHLRDNLTKLSNQKLIGLFRHEKTKVSFAGKPNYRIINNWSKIGVIPDRRDNDAEWRRFSFRDAIWLSLVTELRKFGLSTKKLIEAKEAIGIENEPPHLTLLEYYIALTFQHIPTYLLCFEDGHVELLDEEEFNDTKTLSDLFTHSFILISLNRIIQNLSAEDYPITPFYLIPEGLSKEEYDLLNMIRDHKFHKIEIQKTDGENILIKSTEKILASEAQVKEIMKEKGYQTITLETQDGKTVSVVRTIKKKTRVTRKTGAK